MIVQSQSIIREYRPQKIKLLNTDIPLRSNTNTWWPCQPGLEFTDWKTTKRLGFFLFFFAYDPNLHLNVRLQFWRFEKSEVPHYCQFSQVHFDLERL